MTDLEVLLQIADDMGLKVAWKPLTPATKGLIRGDLVILRKGMTTAESADTLAEEIAHDLLTVGDITDQTKEIARKQEQQARMLAYNLRVGLRGIISCFEAGCRNKYEMAEHLGVTEELLHDALEAYRKHYGVCVEYKGYLIYFEPNLIVFQRR